MQATIVIQPLTPGCGRITPLSKEVTHTHHTHPCTHAHTHTHTASHAHAHTHTHSLTRPRTHTQPHTHTHTHTATHAHAHTHNHTALHHFALHLLYALTASLNLSSCFELRITVCGATCHRTVMERKSRNPSCSCGHVWCGRRQCCKCSTRALCLPLLIS